MTAVKSKLPLTLLPFLLLISWLPAFASPAPQADQDALFNQGVEAYKQNQFTAAIEKFKQVSGTRASEAQQYIGKIQAYTDAMQVAKSTLERTQDELDVRSVEYAIQQLENALKIKPDGPWQPQQRLAKAHELRDQLQKKHAEVSKANDSRFCQLAVTAASEHKYKEAQEFSCLLADDNPGYMCGGDEAVHLCGTNTELASLDKGSLETSGSKSKPERNTPSRSGDFDRAKSAFDSNEFDRARGLLQGIRGDAKPAADDLLDKISRYTDSFSNGEKLSHAAQYDQAHSAFLTAVGIKPDGPGDPQARASRMELLLALEQYYSGDYASAAQHFQSCVATETGKQSLVHFYLGASKLSRFFVTGSGDSALQQQALSELKLAKRAGYKLSGDDVSPKIKQVYETLSN